MSKKKNHNTQLNDMSEAIKDLKETIRNEIIDPLVSPIFSYLAMRDALVHIEAMIPPRNRHEMAIVQSVTKSLPRELRGPYTYLVSSKVKESKSLATAAGESLTEIMSFKYEPKGIDGHD